MKIIFSVFFLFIFSTLYSQWNWCNPFPQANPLNSITYSDNSLTVFGNYGTVLTTTNDGLNWALINRVNDLPHNIKISHRIGADIIYAVGEKTFENYSLIKSTNNGLTWTTITTNNIQFRDVIDLYFVNESIGYYTSTTEICKTSNGGFNWIVLTNASQVENMRVVEFINENTGFVGGGNFFFGSNLMTMTSNGGINWNIVMPFEVEMIFDINFTNANTGYALGNTVYKTTNGGFNWFTQGSPEMSNITKMHFLNSNTGFVTSEYDSEIYTTTNGGSNWTTHSTTNFWIKDVYFLNENTGYLLGANNYLTKTTNSGKSWLNIINYLSTSTANPRLLNATFLNSSTGIAIGWNTTVKKTTNSGVSWYDANVLNVNRHLLDGVFINSTTGYIIQQDSYQGNLLKSTDTGENWTLIDTIGSTNVRLQDIYFISSDIGFILDEVGNLYKTSDNGQSWNIILNVPGNRPFRSIDFQFNTGYLLRSINTESIVYKSTNSGNNWSQIYTYPSYLSTIALLADNNIIAVGRGILKSTNGGQDWIQKYAGNIQDYIFTDVFFPSNSIGYATGRSYGQLDEGVVFKTTNGGDNWHMQRVPTNLSTNSVHFFNSSTGIILGDNETILRTTNGGGNFLSEINFSNINIPEGFLLKQNYPNPFNPSTNISFDIPKSTFVELKIYDISGREIIKLVSQDLNPGSYNYSWEAGNLASGVYFYTLRAGDFISTKKMMLLK